MSSRPRPLPTCVLLTLLLAMNGACAHRDPAPAGRAQAAAAAGNDYRCTQVIGVSVTGDWWNAGFEKGINGDRWQVLWRKQAFVDLWADPANELWQVPLQSPCTEGAGDPDRVIFTAVNWKFTGEQEWHAALAGAVATLQGKYPSVRRIELLTMLRAPGNQSCGDIKTVVQPYVDAAVAKVAAASGGLVVVAPKVYAPSCDVFVKGGPHFTEAGMAVVADAYRSALVGVGAPVAGVAAAR
jgi:hypothetical protein